MGLRVLAVDNEPAILEGMRPSSPAGAAGCSPGISSALAAIRVSGIVPDVILADYHLDEGNGLDVIKTLRWTLSGLSSGAPHGGPHFGCARSCGVRAVHLLNKPVRPAALRALLANGVRAGWPRNEPLTRRRSVRPREYRAPARS